MEKIRLEIASVCHVGKIREKNQDNRIIDGIVLEENPQGENRFSGSFSSQQPVLFGIFDGMGGYYSGEKASSITSKIASEKVFSKDNASICQVLSDICMEANEVVVEESRKIKARVGTTASMLCFNEDKVNVCNIGDSPIFLFNEYGLAPIFEEHTGRKTAERIFGKDKVPQKKYPLTQHIGIDPDEMIIVPYTTTLEVEVGCQYLICSDGLTDMVKEERIAEVLNSQEGVSEKVSILFEEALENGGRDNISIILIQTKEEKEKVSKLAYIAAGAVVLLLGVILAITMLFNKNKEEEPIVETPTQEKLEEQMVPNEEFSQEEPNFAPDYSESQEFESEPLPEQDYETTDREKGHINSDHSDRYNNSILT